MSDFQRVERVDAPAGSGLCATCAHAQVITSVRGSRFLLCRYSAVDPRFPKYPTLPMHECAAYELVSG